MTDRPHILFVDDEPRILDGLRRMLRTQRNRWDMTFTDGGVSALTSMRSRPCDVIVSDYRMPGMDGAELLDRVRAEFPGTARVLLSGQTNEDNLLKIMVLVHEYLTKPTTPEQLVTTLERLLQARAFGHADGQRHDVTFVESLPSPPHTLIELVEALQADDASAGAVGTVIERDPAATAKVLQLVNSSAYTTGHRISDVAQAVVLLGLDTVRGLVLMHDLVRTFDAGDALPPEWIDALTLHSVETSRLARSFCAGAGWQSGAFTAGLLHEIGQLVLASSRPGEFREVLALWRQNDSAPLDVYEQEAFGISHVDVGVSLLGFWGLPAEVIEAARGHAVTLPSALVTDAVSAVALAHQVTEADLGTVCGTCPSFDENPLDEGVRAAIIRWRRERSGLSR